MATNGQEEQLKYYERELTYLREMGAEFGQRYPALANRLDIGDGPSTDPHVERLLESFAFLTGRIQYNLDRAFPEIPSALFNLLYPHLQSPIPSMAIAQFDVDPEQGKLTSGATIPKQTPLFAQMEHGQNAKFRTCYPVTLWPLKVSAAELAPATAQGPLLWLRLEAQGVTLPELAMDRLRFYLSGSESLVSVLYELLFCHAQAVHILPAPPAQGVRPTAELTAISRLSDDSLAPVGFGLDEEILPYPSRAHPAYRLLQEYFAFAKKFHFCEIRNLDFGQLGMLFGLGLSFASELVSDCPISPDLRRAFQNRGYTLAAQTTIAADESQANAWFVVEDEQPSYRIRQTDAGLNVYPANQPAATACDLWIRFDPETVRNLPQLEEAANAVNQETFRLGCTPIINLFAKTSDPVRLDHRQSEYLLLPDVRRQNSTEIHTIERVVALSNQGREEQEMAPYYGLDHAHARRNQKAFWHGRRLPTNRKGAQGSDMWLSFVDLGFNPSRPNEQTVFAQTLCTNRGLAEQLPPGARLQIELSAPLQRITCLDKPTPQVEPPLQGETLWRLVSNLSLNHLSLAERTHFGIAKAHQRNLDNHHLSTHLRQSFRDHAIHLSDNVTVTSNAQATGWRIADQITGRTFDVQEDAGQLSVSSGEDGLAALRELLTLYSFGDRATAHDQIAGIAALSTRRVIQRVTPSMGGGWNGFSRGLEITLCFDETRYGGRSPLLLAAVLNHFFGLYSSMNLFTQLVVQSKQREGIWKAWSPRTGTQHLL